MGLRLVVLQAHGALGLWFPLLPALLGVFPLESGGSAEVQREDRVCSPENLWVPEEIKRAPSSQPLEQDSFHGSASLSTNMSTRGQGKGYFGFSSKMKKTFLSTLPFSNPQHAPSQRRKKFYVYRGKRGKKGSIFLHNKVNRMFSKATNILFQTVNISISSMMPVG